MENPNIRHYFLAAVGGLFCWLNPSVVSAQTATDVDCDRCVEAGELSYGTVGWWEVSYGFKRHMNNQAADASNALASVNALLERVVALEISVAALTNNAPTINNPTINYSVIENQTAAFTVSATDPDGDVLSYSISGSDSSKLNIDSNGTVTFQSTPDYENPVDIGTNNIYDISVSVSDGVLSATQNFTITVADQAIEVDYYASPTADPEHIPGTFHPKHCWVDIESVDHL